MRVVLDTNVFVSGIHWSGNCERILYAWFKDKFMLVSSPEIISEFTRVMLSFKVPMETEEIKRWEDLILQKCVLVMPTGKIEVVEDPDDNKFIEAAVEGKADFIVSQDKHLLKIRQFENIKIINPLEFLNILKKSG